MYWGYILSVARLVDRLDDERVIEKKETKTTLRLLNTTWVYSDIIFL